MDKFTLGESNYKDIRIYMTKFQPDPISQHQHIPINIHFIPHNNITHHLPIYQIFLNKSFKNPSSFAAALGNIFPDPLV